LFPPTSPKGGTTGEDLAPSVLIFIFPSGGNILAPCRAGLMDTSVPPDSSAPPPVARLPAARRYLRRMRPADKQRQQQQPIAAAGASSSPFAAVAASLSQSSPTPSRFNPFASVTASRKVAPVITLESISFGDSTTAANPFSLPHASVFPSVGRPASFHAAAPIFTAGTGSSRGDVARPATPLTPLTTFLANSSAAAAANPARDSCDVAETRELSVPVATGRSGEAEDGNEKIERSREEGVAGTLGRGSSRCRLGEGEDCEIFDQDENGERPGERPAGEGRNVDAVNWEGTFDEGRSGEGRFGEGVYREARIGECGTRLGEEGRDGRHAGEEERQEGDGDEGGGHGRRELEKGEDEHAEEDAIEDISLQGNSVEDEEEESAGSEGCEGSEGSEGCEGSEGSEESEGGDEGEEDDTASDASSDPPRAPSPSPPPNLNPLALLALSHAPFPSASSITSTTATTFSGGTSPTLSSAAAASSRSAVSPPTSPSAPSPFSAFSIAPPHASHPIPHPRPPSSAVVNMASLTASQKFAKLLQQLAKQSAELSELRGELADAKAEVAEMQAVVAQAGLDFVRERMEKERLGQACAKLNNALLTSRRETSDERERRELAERLAVAAELARRQLLEEITLERAQLARADNWREHNLHLKLVEAQMVVSEKVGILEVVHAELEKKFRQVGAGRLWRGEEERPFGWFLKFLGQPEGKAWVVEGLGGGGGGEGGMGDRGKGKVEDGGGSAGTGGDGALRDTGSSSGAASNAAGAQDAEHRGDSDSARGSTESDCDEDDNDRIGSSSDSLSEAVPLVGGGGDELRIPKLRDRSGNAGGSSSSARIPGRGGGSRCRWRGDRLLDAEEPTWQGGYHGCSACGHGRASAVAAAAAGMCSFCSSCGGRGTRSRASGVGGNGGNGVESLSLDGWLGLSALEQWCATAAAVTVASVNSVCGGEQAAAGGAAGRREGIALSGMRLPFSSCFDSQYTLSATHDNIDDDADEAGAGARNGRAAEPRQCGCLHRSRLGPSQSGSNRGCSVEMGECGVEESGERRGKGKAPAALLPPRPQRVARGEGGTGGERGCGGGEYCRCCGRCCRCPSGNRMR
ncbi:hypothetical protein CLOP_g16338, partial [Closterium sp. NIES-67]